VENNIADIKEKDQFIVSTSEYVKDHLNRYFWLQGNYVYSEEYSYEHFMKTALSLNENHKIDFSKIRKDKQNLILKHKFNKKILTLARMTELFIDWQDHRKIFSLVHSYFCQKLVSEISKRTRIPESFLKYASFEELEHILNNDFDVSILKKRRQGMMLIYEMQGWQLLTGAQAYELFLKATHQEYDFKNEIKGLTASLGKVTGIARVVLSLNDLKKVQEGDIIIAPMTRPEHIIAMKRASAIVTDDGGITCHAAIVSRELGIPCVIGTNFATKVFKDGDLIEVDANSGTVRKTKV
jgi:phosphoenolpyruvate synthase/pyruvate phosphate dikinase